jgi:hypothetical protein
MNLIHPTSLAQTLDAINEAFFFGKSLTKSDKEAAANWLAGRQDLPRAYAGMFAPTERDLKEGLTLFTGEKIATRAGVSHILGEETCRALIFLESSQSGVKAALERASLGIMHRLSATPTIGAYCCGKCSVALWRHLAVGGLPDVNPERWLEGGIKTLGQYRDSSGRWGRFPFYYTLLALSEIDLPSARKEMRYAAPICERLLKRTASKDKFAQRRRLLAERILAKC